MGWFGFDELRKARWWFQLFLFSPQVERIQFDENHHLVLIQKLHPRNLIQIPKNDGFLDCISGFNSGVILGPSSR